jgi:hypothetical protein
MYLDVSDETSLTYECKNFPKSGATSKLYAQNGRQEASSTRQPTNIRRYYTKFARIHDTQNNVA